MALPLRHLQYSTTYFSDPKSADTFTTVKVYEHTSFIIMTPDVSGGNVTSENCGKSLTKNRSHGQCGKIKTGTEMYIFHRKPACLLFPVLHPNVTFPPL